jgi:uncharacterized protein (TIGR02996 family)
MLEALARTGRRTVTHDEAFLQAIIDNPDDDTPRLVYADWLDERSNPDRAEFIRLQCELARLDEDDPRRDALQQRTEDLLAAHQQRWLAALPEGMREVEKDVPVFRRGFPSNLSMPCAAFVERGEELRRAAPVERLHIQEIGSRAGNLAGEPRAAVNLIRAIFGTALEGVGEQVARLAACPWLARFPRLDLSQNDLTGAHLATLFASPHWPELLELDLNQNRAGPQGAAVIAESPRVSGLRRLDLGRNEVGAAGVAVLAASPHLANLAVLGLSSNRIDDAGAVALARSTTLTRLTELDLGFNALTAAGVPLLLSSRNLTAVEALNLGGNGPSQAGLGDAVVAAVVSSPVLGPLRRLALRHAGITPEGVRLLAESTLAAGLRELNLVANKLGVYGARWLATVPARRLRQLWLESTSLGDAGAQILAGSANLTQNLRVLGLERNGIGSAGMAALAGCPHLTHLQEIALDENTIGPDGATALAGAAWLGQLRKLDLTANNIGDAGVRALAASPGVARLAELNLWNNQLGDEAATALAGCPHLSKLRSLHLTQNGITETGATALAESPHLGRLEFLGLASNPIGEAGQATLRKRFGERVVCGQRVSRPPFHAGGPSTPGTGS